MQLDLFTPLHELYSDLFASVLPIAQFIRTGSPQVEHECLVNATLSSGQHSPARLAATVAYEVGMQWLGLAVVLAVASIFRMTSSPISRMGTSIGDWLMGVQLKARTRTSMATAISASATASTAQCRSDLSARIQDDSIGSRSASRGPFAGALFRGAGRRRRRTEVEAVICGCSKTLLGTAR